LDGYDPDGARSVVADFLIRSPDGGWLAPEAVDNLLDAAGVRTPASRTVVDAEEAVRAATHLGFPVALKATGPELVHKSDVGGVRLGLTSEVEVGHAYRAMAAEIGTRMTGGLVQEMVAPGLETIVGVVHHPLFGPLVMFGMGGVDTELRHDRSFRILPLTDVDAAELVRSLRATPLLFGYRGTQPVALTELEDLLQRVARLAGDVPALAELDINPLIASPSGAVAVDVRARVAPVSPGPLPDLRQMAG
jgi:acyl-CoA synthetase (NDP forming)